MTAAVVEDRKVKRLRSERVRTADTDGLFGVELFRFYADPQTGARDRLRRVYRRVGATS